MEVLIEVLFGTFGAGVKNLNHDLKKSFERSRFSPIFKLDVPQWSVFIRMQVFIETKLLVAHFLSKLTSVRPLKSRMDVYYLASIEFEIALSPLKSQQRPLDLSVTS